MLGRFRTLVNGRNQSKRTYKGVCSRPCNEGFRREMITLIIVYLLFQRCCSNPCRSAAGPTRPIILIGFSRSSGMAFVALLYSDSDGVRLISRNGNTFKSFPGLCKGLAIDLNGRRCVLDGEIACLDSHGQPQFRKLLFRRAEPFFYAFDILWDEHARSDDEEEMRRFRNGETFVTCHSPTGSFVFAGSCRNVVNVFCTATT